MTPAAKKPDSIVAMSLIASVNNEPEPPMFKGSKALFALLVYASAGMLGGTKLLGTVARPIREDSPRS